MLTKLGAATALILLASVAHASDIPILTGVSAAGSDHVFNYQASLSSDQGLTAGDQVAIIDFAGYVAGSVASANPLWTASVSDTLPAGLVSPPGVTDSAAVPDLIFTYIGPDYQVTGGPYPSQTDYVGLSAESTYGDSIFGSYSAEAIKNSGSTQDTADYNVGSVGVPSGAPEPAAWAMLIVGLAGVGGILRRKQAIALAI